MRPTLQLRIGQHLTMTPQLQQAIKLLQLSTLELQQEIQEVLESNPLLELDEKAQADSASEQNNLEEAYSSKSNEEKSDQPTNDGSEEQLASIDEISTTEAMCVGDVWRGRRSEVSYAWGGGGHYKG